jgi:hypothetical protein
VICFEILTICVWVDKFLENILEESPMYIFLTVLNTYFGELMELFLVKDDTAYDIGFLRHE